MAIDVANLPDKKLETLINNHKERRVFDATFRDAIAEKAWRGGTSLDVERTLALVSRAAGENRFVSYLEIAEANGAAWEKARFAIFRHLSDLLDIAHSRGLPLLTAIVVAKPHLKDGMMDEKTLTGFVTAARDLGYVVTDAEGFMREQQRATFAWGTSAKGGAN